MGGPRHKQRRSIVAGVHPSLRKLRRYKLPDYAIYLEDDDAMFRFDYSTDFLKWALNPPGQYSEWLAVVKLRKNGKIMAFISAIPLQIMVDGK